jgi:vacuolar protein sorting-associated protein 35
LEGIDVNEYKEQVLPKILEQVISCKDTIAQSYLMDCVIQVFPDDYHLATLQPFLGTCSELKDKVNVRGILESMMDRLANYASTGATLTTEINAFQMFNDCVTQLVENRTNLSLVEILRLHTALLNFALKCYPSNLDYINHCLSTAASIIKGVNYETPNTGPTNAPSEDTTVLQMETLLTSPLTQLSIGVLTLANYEDLLDYLPWGNKKAVSVELLRSIILHSNKLSDVEQVEKLFTIITPLIRDQEGAEGTVTTTDEEGKEQVVAPGFEEEQTLVARLVHLMDHEDTDALFRLYIVARRHFGQGGVHRIQHTLVPLIFAALKLARAVRQRYAIQNLAQALKTYSRCCAIVQGAAT